MNRPAPQDVRNITCIGGGVIGAGWAAGFLAKGYDVTVQDINASAEDQMRRIIDSAWPSLETMGLAAGASKDRVRFTTDLADAVANADFVQESGPERMDIKQDMYAAMDAAMPNDVVIASSTSGLLMSDIQIKSGNASRMVLGHPFNPPYLMPLVEVVGGKKTDPSAVDWACEFYRVAGKHPLKMDREVLGHIADRLQQAMWNEIVYMVDADEATPEQIDESIIHGFGPRLAIMGYCLLFHLAGGEGGMRHFMKHFDPSVSDDWTRLPSPPITDELVEKFAAGAERLQGGRTTEELNAQRDEALVGFLQHFNKVTAKG
ncbi:MAG: L-carnitine dehydrogenase [Rhodospirillaceae bacterium]|jgi:carnitine 3-dehydrogenase|nr:L-carnitine dehydrogenase [Rhodospirillaceae bacterium]MBT7648817.1 L-carnitine dehydrogenase [Rhodospirillaceae bacterium]